MILSISLVLAVSVDTNKDDYNGGETVSISVNQCTGTSILKIVNPGLNIVDIKAGSDSWSTSYNTLSDSASGKYTITVSCEDGSTNANFCVDDPGCLGLQTQSNDNQTTSGTGTGTGTGSGLSCNPQFSCSSWSYCNNELKQTRDCTDLNACEQPRQESRDCSQCDESWICSQWSQCSNGLNTRDCYDEHDCGTVLLKPDLQKSCQASSTPGPQPVRISNQLPPPSYAKPQELSGFAKFWNDYKLLVIIGLLGIIILLIIILLLIHFLKPKHYAYNMDELKKWVSKERTMGTSNEDIRSILKQHTGWKDKEIDAAFESLRPEPMPKQKPISTAPIAAKTSLPEYTAAREEATIMINNVPVKSKTTPAEPVGKLVNKPVKKLVQKKPVVKKMKRFSGSRTVFRKTVKNETIPKKITVAPERAPPKRVAWRKHKAKKSVKVHKKTAAKKPAKSKSVKKSTKISKIKKSSQKGSTVTTTTTTTVKKVSRGKRKSSKPKKEVVRTVKTVVKKKKK